MSSKIRASSGAAPEFIMQLRAARLEAGLSQEALGGSLGWSRERIRAYESGNHAVVPRIAEQWAQAVGRTITTQPASLGRPCLCYPTCAAEG